MEPLSTTDLWEAFADGWNSEPHESVTYKNAKELSVWFLGRNMKEKASSEIERIKDD